MPVDQRVLMTESLTKLGVTLPTIVPAPFEQQQQQLETWKDEVMTAAWKKLAMKYHPDRNQGQDTTAQMAEINAARDVLTRLKVAPPRPPPQVFQSFNPFAGFGGFGAGTATTTTMNGVRVTVIRWG